MSTAAKSEGADTPHCTAKQANPFRKTALCWQLWNPRSRWLDWKAKPHRQQKGQDKLGVTSPFYKEVDGIYISSFFKEDNLRSAFAYKPRPDDVFVASYPKCGTTWMQCIVHCILNDAVLPDNSVDFMLASPFIDFTGAEGPDRMSRPGAIKTHLPFDKVPYSPQAKYIYVTRNPYDCCVSYYHHILSTPLNRPEDGDFGQFLERFMRGRVNWGDYFYHLLSWYDHRHDPNVLFVTFEELKRDTSSGILKVADFLGKHYGCKLRQDEALLRRILEVVEVREMRKIFNDDMLGMMSRFLSLPPEKALRSLEVCKAPLGAVQDERKKEEFIRKGVVGDYKLHFTTDQASRMKDWITTKTKNSDVMLLWKDIDLP
ncbi:sulfotransferase 1E1 [Ixodes scapularis]|uniref:sulfotransferase 1E1 n=1 Tax=Ixodes scapularis TaxID=6945 RepID=UPI001A9FF68F|nr:sulfotransferase 1E1 [Ixodes scapularis]